MKKRLSVLFCVLLAVSFSVAQKTPVNSDAKYSGILERKMIPETLWEMGRVSGAQLSPDGNKMLYGVTRYELETNGRVQDLYVYDFDTKETLRLTDGSGVYYNAVWHPQGHKIGYITAQDKGPQIWEMKPDGTDKKQLTKIEGGVSGFLYAPTADRILYTKRVKLDKTINDLHPDLPLAEAKIIDDLMYRHWDKWTDEYYSHIFVASYKDGVVGKGKDIMEGERFHAPIPPFGGMSQITFSPNGQKIAYTCKKLTGKEFTLSTNSNIYIYDIKNGTTRNLTQNMPGYDKYPVFSPDGNKLAWQSMATPGFESDKARLMVYDFKNNTMQYLTEGFDQSASNFVWRKDGRHIYFISGIHATYQLYNIDISSKKITQITEGKHNISSVDKKGERLIVELMSMSLPTEIFSVNESDGALTQITKVNNDILSKIEMGKVEKRWVKTTDGKDMLVWVIYPPYFDPEKKYPTLLYCQGGPQSAVSQFFSYRWNFQMMAAHDYIVVAPNRRGLPTFGQEWNDQISGDYGGQNMLDYLSAIDALAKEPFVDEGRLGAVGASYGGFSVFWLAGNHDKRFKAFIAHCGMFNFESWYASTEEMFFANHDLGGPYWAEEKPISYSFSPHRFVGNWDTPILVIHGENDFRIPYTEGMQAFNAAQLQDIPSRFLYFPTESHFVLRPQNSVLWQREFFRWLDKWLK